MTTVSFSALSTFTALLAATLVVLLCFFPGLIYWLFGLENHATADLLAKRASGLFTGYTVLSWLIRDAEASALLRKICIALGIMMAALTFVSLYEFLRGFAGPGILLAAITEATLAALYFRHARA